MACARRRGFARSPSPGYANLDNRFPAEVSLKIGNRLRFALMLGAMMGAIGLVLVGLPVALGAIFHFVLPLMGQGW